MWTCTSPHCPATAHLAVGWGTSPHFHIVVLCLFCIFITLPYHATHNFGEPCKKNSNVCPSETRYGKQAPACRILRETSGREAMASKDKPLCVHSVRWRSSTGRSPTSRESIKESHAFASGALSLSDCGGRLFLEWGGGTSADSACVEEQT